MRTVVNSSTETGSGCSKSRQIFEQGSRDLGVTGARSVSEGRSHGESSTAWPWTERRRQAAETANSASSAQPTQRNCCSHRGHRVHRVGSSPVSVFSARCWWFCGLCFCALVFSWPIEAVRRSLAQPSAMGSARNSHGLLAWLLDLPGGCLTGCGSSESPTGRSAVCRP